MNKRTLIVGISLILAVCLDLHFYAQWDMKRFDASLPEVPVPEQAADLPDFYECLSCGFSEIFF